MADLGSADQAKLCRQCSLRYGFKQVSNFIVVFYCEPLLEITN